MNFLGVFKKIEIAAVSIMCICLTAFFVYCSNKGIDNSDEAFNLLFSNIDQKHNFSLFNHNVFLSSIQNLLGVEFSIADLRIIRLFSLLLSGLFLLFSLKNIFGYSKKVMFEIGSVFILSIFVTYARGTLTLNYNSIILICSFILISFFIRIIQKPDKILNYIAFSIVLFIIFLTKMTSSFLLSGAFSLFFIIEIFQKKNNAWKHMFFYSGGLLLVFTFFWILIPQSRLTHVLDVISNTDKSGYSFLDMFIGFNMNITYVFSFLFLGLGASFISKKVQEKYQSILFGLISLLVYVHLYIVNWNQYTENIRLSLFVFFLVGSSLDHIKKEFEGNKRYVLILLLILPLFLFAGTNNLFIIHIYTSAPLLFLFSFLVNRKVIFNGMILLLFTATLVFELRDNIIRYPYKQEAFQNNTEIIKYKGDNHFVTKAFKSNTDKLNAILNASNFESDYILAVSKLIGEVVFSGKSFPSTPLWKIDGIDLWLSNNSLPNKFFIVCNLKQELEFLEKIEKLGFKIKYLDSYQKTKFNGITETIKCFSSEK